MRRQADQRDVGYSNGVWGLFEMPLDFHGGPVLSSVLGEVDQADKNSKVQRRGI